MFEDQDVTDKVFDTFNASARVQQQRELYIRADENARYGTVAEVVAAARRSGVDSLNLLVQPEEGPDDEPAEQGKSEPPK
jgi:biopolymer transport protein TolR